MSSTPALPQVLICDDDSLFHMALKQALKGIAECRSAYNSDEALVIVRNHPVDLVLLDVQMRTSDEGLKAIPRLKEADGDVAIVMSSALTDFVTVREAMRLGAIDYVAKDFDPNELVHTLTTALERRRILRTSEQRHFELLEGQRRHVLVGESPAIRQLRKTIEKIRASDANVLITGETGTGKEVVARQLRKILSDGSLEPFVAVDSSTIQSTMAESVLFGHEKGAFTGAERTTKGVFEEAAGGVVYFDELGNMPLEIQAKLLRAIQEKEITRLGSTRSMSLDFRVIAATNHDLENASRESRFKYDLFQRLNVLPIHLPPLRERREDIPLLAGHLLARQGVTGQGFRFNPEALEVLQSYDWPGNIRELANLVAYVTAMTEGTEIDVADLPPRVRDRKASSPSPSAETAEAGGSFYDQVSSFEKELLAREYAKSQGNVSRIAMRLGMDRSHLYTKLREHGIHQTKKR